MGVGLCVRVHVPSTHCGLNWLILGCTGCCWAGWVMLDQARLGGAAFY